MKAQFTAATAIKNFLYLLLVTSFVFTSGCQTGLKTRPQPTPKALPSPQQDPVIIDSQIPTQATPVPEAFLEKKAPKVGIILGPGGMRAFAHVGVLKEFARAKISVDAIVGLEWGALFAGIYAQQAQVNDLEWKALQLKETDVPGKAWLSARVKPESVGILNSYLQTSFGSSLMEKAKVPYACPTANLTQDKVTWLGKGSMRDAMTKCLPYLPYFTDNSGYLAAPFAIEEAASFLRSRGAQLIIFVNVLSEGQLFPNRLVSDYYAENVLWSEVRRQLSKSKITGINVVIPVSTSDKSLLDFDQRKFFIDAGSRSARDQVNNLVTQYGF